MPDPTPDDLPPDVIRGPSQNEPGMWLTASSWLPAALLDGSAEPGRTPVEAALSQGGPLDAMPPGPVLVAFLTEVSAPAIPGPPTIPASSGHAATPDSLATRIASGAGLPQLGDNALLGLIRGWRRVASLAAAAELAAVHEVSKRRHDQAKADGSRGTQMLLERAEMQHELPAAATALAAGQIDWPRALVLSTGLTGQEPELARPIGGKH